MPGVVEGGCAPRRTLRVPTPTSRGEGGARRRAARDDSQPSRTRCPMSGWPRRSGSRTPTSRQSKHSPGEVRRWLGSRVVHCVWPGPSAPSSQCVAGFGLPHFVPPWVPLLFQRGPTPSRAGRHLPAEQSFPGEAPPAESRVSIASRRQAHPPGGERPSRRSTPRGGEDTPGEAHPCTSRHRHSPPGDLLPGGVRHGRTVSLRGEARPLHPESPLGPENPSSLPLEVHPREGTRTSSGRHPIQ